MSESRQFNAKIINYLGLKPLLSENRLLSCVCLSSKLCKSQNCEKGSKEDIITAMNAINSLHCTLDILESEEFGFKDLRSSCENIISGQRVTRFRDGASDNLQWSGPATAGSYLTPQKYKNTSC